MDRILQVWQIHCRKTFSSTVKKEGACSSLFLLDFYILNTVFQNGCDDLIPGTVCRIRNSIQLGKQIRSYTKRNDFMSIL